jgi:6-phosphogluconolactonase
MTKIGLTEEQGDMKERVLIKENPHDVNLAAAEAFFHLATEAVVRKGFFTVALSGGSTPKGLYSLLASESHSFRGSVPWQKIHFFWGDERYVPQDHPDSNFRMAQEILLSKVPVNRDNVHPVDTRVADAERAARAYEEVVRHFFGLKQGEVPQFDLLLLGLGTDGHTASIFPGSDIINESELLVAAYTGGAVPTPRITVTPPIINNALNTIFLVTGREKSGVLQKVLNGDYRPETCPAQLTRQCNGNVIWLVDKAAANCLKNNGRSSNSRIETESL